METNLFYQYLPKRSGENTIYQPNTVYIGETLSNFLQYSPEKIACFLVHILFQARLRGAPFVPEKVSVGLRRRTLTFLLKSHPFYSGLKESVDINFVHRFITGALVYYKYSRKKVVTRISKERIEGIFGIQYGKVFSEYEAILLNNADSGSPTDMTKVFTNDCFWGYLNAYRLTETILEGITDCVSKRERDELLLSHLMAGYIAYCCEKDESQSAQSSYIDSGIDKYKMYLDFLSDCGLELYPKPDKSYRFDTLQMAVLKEMTFFLMGNFKICRCNQCHKYYIYSGEKHSSCCSEIYYQYKPATYKYWNKQIEKVKGAIRKQMDSSDKAGKDEIDGISELFTYQNISDKIRARCYSEEEFNAYFSLVLGSYYARTVETELDGKKIVSRKRTYLDREQLIQFLEGNDDLFYEDESLEIFLEYIKGNLSKDYEIPKRWEKAKKYLNSQEYKKIPRSPIGQLYVVSSEKTYKDAEGGDRQ